MAGRFRRRAPASRSRGERGLRIAVVYPQVRREVPCGKALLRLIEDLADSHSVTVYAISVEPALLEKVTCIRLRCPSRPYLLSYVLFHVLATVVYAYRRIVLRARNDVIQSVDSHCVFANVVTVHYCNAERIRLMREGVFRSQGSRARRAYDWIVHRLSMVMEHCVYRFPPRKELICISAGLAENLVEHHKLTRTPHVIPNSSDPPRVTLSKEEARELLVRRHLLPRDSFVLVFVGASDWERKGLRHVLEALCQLPPDVFLLVVGAGSRGEAARYLKMAEDLGVPGRTIFTGPQREVHPYFRGSDVFVFPSHFEGFALVTLEAAEAGLPMLCTDVNGVRDLFGESECGLLVRPSASDLADRVKSLMKDRARLARMGKSAEERASLFSRRHVAERTLAVYRLACGDRSE
jgi:UDP-glucose:(heptosyl)LPS alpha-1,3-glucosyltransferase